MKIVKLALKIIAFVLAGVILIVGGYLAYVFISYHRIGDAVLTAEGKGSGVARDGEEYSILSYNIGFGAYESDYGFFMDGGTESRAWSVERLDKNLENIASIVDGLDPDFCLLQEVDIDSTRSYHIDEREYFKTLKENKSYIFAQNYDSPYLFYPVLKPHGASESGLMTFSAFDITDASRRELPIETGLMKFLDLDRCYSKSTIPIDNGKILILYNFHLSAYTSDGAIATRQLHLILNDMEKEYRKGNCYCIAGGDFNKDILGDSSKYFGAADKEYTWAQPIPEGMFDGYNISVVAPLDEDDPVPSCRNADSAYHEGQYVLTIDGFLVSANVEVTSSRVIDTQFAYSDHNPVEMTFILN
ncbi:MAG: endonuclease/exonuclease/phosphatase family protein [Clostridia bacterium]|nr:endonuclease/exonuclease/phosphatase family protein [Clostridia bacterium]